MKYPLPRPSNPVAFAEGALNFLAENPTLLEPVYNPFSVSASVLMERRRFFQPRCVRCGDRSVFNIIASNKTVDDVDRWLDLCHPCRMLWLNPAWVPPSWH